MFSYDDPCVGRAGGVRDQKPCRHLWPRTLRLLKQPDTVMADWCQISGEVRVSCKAIAVILVASKPVQERVRGITHQQRQTPDLCPATGT